MHMHVCLHESYALHVLRACRYPGTEVTGVVGTMWVLETEPLSLVRALASLQR